MKCHLPFSQGLAGSKYAVTKSLSFSGNVTLFFARLPVDDVLLFLKQGDMLLLTSLTAGWSRSPVSNISSRQCIRFCSRYKLASLDFLHFYLLLGNYFLASQGTNHKSTTFATLRQIIYLTSIFTFLRRLNRLKNSRVHPHTKTITPG